MEDLHSLAHVMETLLKRETWQPQEARAVLRAGRALAREKGCPGIFDLMLRPEHEPAPPSAA